MHAQRLELPDSRQLGSFSQKFLDEAWAHHLGIQSQQGTIRPLIKSEVSEHQDLLKAEQMVLSSEARPVEWVRMSRVLILCDSPLGSKLDRLRTKYRDVTFEVRSFWNTGVSLPRTQGKGEVRALAYVGEHGIESVPIPDYVALDLKKAQIPWLRAAGINKIDAILALSQKAPYSWE